LNFERVRVMEKEVDVLLGGSLICINKGLVKACRTSITITRREDFDAEKKLKQKV